MTSIMKKFGFVVCLSAAVSLASLMTGCQGDEYTRSTGETVDDASVTAQVKTELLADPQVSGMDVKVDTFRGTVQLTGFADTFEQKQRAEQLTRNINGVQSVRNDIIVKEAAGGQPRRSGTDLDVDVDRDSSGAELEIEKNNSGAEIEVEKK
jgi:hyperosmotically inducible protein